MAKSIGSSPIDAKKFPAPILIGAVIMIIGMIVMLYGLVCIIRAAMDELSAFGFVGGLMIAGLGILLVVIGAVLLFGGIMGKLFGGRYKRIIY